MGYKALVFLVCVAAAGCAHSPAEQRKLYEHAYEQQVKEDMQGALADFKQGNFPYYHWESPIVQEVVVPAHIANGMFVPQHKETVIIKPGEWRKDPGYPLATKEEEYERHARMDISAADITHLPGRMGGARGDQPAGEEGNSATGVEPAK